MGVSLNGAGNSHANALVSSGKVDEKSSWSFTAEDGNALLGNDNWSEYGKWFLGTDSSADPKTKEHYKYPFGKNGKVYRSALRAIRTRAAQNNETEIFDAAGRLMDKIDKANMADMIPELGVVKDVEVFSIGTWSGSQKVKVDSAYLDNMISSFQQLNASVTGFAAPIKIGHNTRVGEPAYGWVSDLRRVGDKIVADFADVPGDMIDAIKKRLYNSVSIEVYPAVEYAGKVFKNVLGAVALLGAEWPAVKGLKPLSASLFAECDLEKLELVQKEEVEMTTFTQEQHDTLLNAAVSTAVTAAKAEMQAAHDEAVEKATKESERADRAEAALASFQSSALDAQISGVIEDAIKEGRILPKQKEEMTAMASVFKDKASTKVKIGDKEVTVLDMFKSYIAGLPKAVKFGEKGAAKPVTHDGEFDTASEEVDAKAKAKMAADKELNYSQAVAAVFAEDEALKTRYAEEN